MKSKKYAIENKIKLIGPLWIDDKITKNIFKDDKEYEIQTNIGNIMLHYDLKPENILFHNYQIKISDFGFAKIIENNSNEIELSYQGVGTYWYLPSECFEISRNVLFSPKVDIWSAGFLLFEMLYGKKPFGQNSSKEKLLKDKII